MFKDVLNRQQKEREQLEVAVLTVGLLIALPFILAAKALKFCLRVLDRTIIAILHFL
jgi:hypothetical protein